MTDTDFLFNFSGAVHAKAQITVTQQNSYTIQGEFSAPTARGMSCPLSLLTVPTDII